MCKVIIDKRTIYSDAWFIPASMRKAHEEVDEIELEQIEVGSCFWWCLCSWFLTKNLWVERPQADHLGSFLSFLIFPSQSVWFFLLNFESIVFDLFGVWRLQRVQSHVATCIWEVVLASSQQSIICECHILGRFWKFKLFESLAFFLQETWHILTALSKFGPSRGIPEGPRKLETGWNGNLSPRIFGEISWVIFVFLVFFFLFF